MLSKSKIAFFSLYTYVPSFLFPRFSLIFWNQQKKIPSMIKLKTKKLKRRNNNPDKQNSVENHTSWKLIRRKLSRLILKLKMRLFFTLLYVKQLSASTLHYKIRYSKVAKKCAYLWYYYRKTAALWIVYTRLQWWNTPL